MALAICGSAATYQVSPGDTLTAIASRFNTSVGALTSANALHNPSRIFAGQHLTIPDVGPPAPLPGGLLAHRDRLALRPVFRRWAAAYGVPPDLLEALAWMESGWQNSVVSPTHARGIGQVEPSTVSFVDSLVHKHLNPHVASDNIRISARFLRYLLDQCQGNVAMAVGSYYQGLHSMQQRGPMPGTKQYIAGVLVLRPAFSPG